MSAPTSVSKEAVKCDAAVERDNAFQQRSRPQESEHIAGHRKQDDHCCDLQHINRRGLGVSTLSLQPARCVITVLLAHLALFVTEAHALGELVAGEVTRRVVPTFSLRATPRAVPLHGLTGLKQEQTLVQIQNCM